MAKCFLICITLLVIIFLFINIINLFLFINIIYLNQKTK